MKRGLLVLSIILFSISAATASIVPDKIEFYYIMGYDDLRLALEQEGVDYEKDGRTIILDYDDFYVSVYEDHFEMNCKEVNDVCMDGRTLEVVLEDLEHWNTFDLSKDDKETIASLYRANIQVRHIEKRDLYFVKMKAAFLSFLGKLFCTNYEEIIECNNDWCSLEVLKSSECSPELDDY